MSQKTFYLEDFPELVFIPTGPFWMGSSDDDPEAHPNEKPQHRIKIDDYWIGTYPVTNTQYAQFIQATNHPLPVHWPTNQPPSGLENHPVVNISYFDALVYCEWLSGYTNAIFRLPTEQEWEKAARGTTTFRYVWGNEWHSEYCNTRESGHMSTTPVDTFTEHNRSQYGAVDLLGNVWEWTDNWYRPYPGSPHPSSKYGEKYRIVRAGAWSTPKNTARISARGRAEPDSMRSRLGFRLTATPNYKIKNNTALFEFLKKHFNLGEIQKLCFAADIQYENIPGDTKDAKIRSLIQHTQRHNLVTNIRKIGMTTRPKLAWNIYFVPMKITIEVSHNANT